MDAELKRWQDSGEIFDYLGFDIFFRVAGSGPPLLLIHGYPFNSYDWAPVWPTLSQRFTVIAPDMIGRGFSAKPVTYEYAVADHADMHEALLAHLNIHNAHILAHDLGDSVGQELLARHEFGQQAYGALRIDSITWLNGGMFIEAYTPRTAQKLMSRTPLGDIFSHVQGSPLSRRLLEPTLREMFRPEHQADPADDERVQRDLGLQRRPPGAAQGRPVHQRSLHPPQPVGARHAADRGADAVDRRTDRPQLWCPYGAALRRSDTRTRCGDARRRHRNTWPQLEAPDAVLEHFLAHIDRIARLHD